MNSRQWAGLDHNARLVIINCRHDHENPICPDCTALLAGTLDDIPALLRDLDTAIIRDVHFPEHGTTALTEADPEESSLPFDDRALDAKNDLASALRNLAELDHIAGRPANLARQLRAHLGRLARHPDIPRHAHAITAAVAAAHKAIDRPPSLWYYGPCPKCDRDIYAPRIDEDDRLAHIGCPRPDCDYAAPLQDHRLAQLDAGDDRMLTVGELVGAITEAGETVTRDQINGWIRREGLPRERLTRFRWIRGTRTFQEVWVYRLGDVRRLALEAESRKTRTQAS